MTSWSNIETCRNHSCLFVCCRVSLFSVSSNSNWHQQLSLNELNEKKKSCNSSSQKSTLFTFFFFCCILFLCLFVCPCLPFSDSVSFNIYTKQLHAATAEKDVFFCEWKMRVKNISKFFETFFFPYEEEWWISMWHLLQTISVKHSV